MLSKVVGIPSRRGAQPSWSSVWCYMLVLLLHLAGLFDNAGMWLSLDHASGLGALRVEASSVESFADHSRSATELEYGEESDFSELSEGTAASWRQRSKSVSSARRRDIARQRKVKQALWAAALVTPLMLGLSAAGLRRSSTGAGQPAEAVDAGEAPTHEAATAEPAEIAGMGADKRRLYKTILATLLPVSTALLLHYFSQYPSVFGAPDTPGAGGLKEDVEGAVTNYVNLENPVGTHVINATDYGNLQCPVGSQPKATPHPGHF